MFRAFPPVSPPDSTAGPVAWLTGMKGRLKLNSGAALNSRLALVLGTLLFFLSAIFPLELHVATTGTGSRTRSGFLTTPWQTVLISKTSEETSSTVELRVTWFIDLLKLRRSPDRSSLVVAKTTSPSHCCHLQTRKTYNTATCSHFNGASVLKLSFYENLFHLEVLHLLICEPRTSYQNQNDQFTRRKVNSTDSSVLRMLPLLKTNPLLVTQISRPDFCDPRVRGEKEVNKVEFSTEILL